MGFGCSDCGGGSVKDGARCPWCWRGFPGQPPRSRKRFTISAGDLREGMAVVEIRMRPERRVELDVLRVDHGRFSHYWLSDGSHRSLSPYVEVEIA